MNMYKQMAQDRSRWWFHFFFHPTWGNDPIWLIFQMGWNHQLDGSVGEVVVRCLLSFTQPMFETQRVPKSCTLWKIRSGFGYVEYIKNNTELIHEDICFNLILFDDFLMICSFTGFWKFTVFGSVFYWGRFVCVCEAACWMIWRMN